KSKTSKFGIAFADCELASEILDGDYTIRCRVGPVESSTTVAVRKYVLPKFKLAIDFDQAYYQPGQKVNAVVSAGYVFGEPVVGGRVEIELRRGDINGPVLAKTAQETGADGKSAFEFVLPDKSQFGSGDSQITLTAFCRDTAGQQQARTATRVV